VSDYDKSLHRHEQLAIALLGQDFYRADSLIDLPFLSIHLTMTL